MILKSILNKYFISVEQKAIMQISRVHEETTEKSIGNQNGLSMSSAFSFTVTFHSHHNIGYDYPKNDPNYNGCSKQ